MAGQFFVYSVTQREIDALMNGLPGTRMSATMHLDIGWNPASRQILANVEAGNPPANRAGLPPHKYLEIPAMTQKASSWIFSDQGSLFCEKLRRPANISKGLSAAGGASAEWALGRLKNAFSIELSAGNVSIEIYRIDGAEVG